MSPSAYIILSIIFLCVLWLLWRGHKYDEFRENQRGKNIKSFFSSLTDFTPNKVIVGIKNMYALGVDEKKEKIAYVKGDLHYMIPFNRIVDAYVVDDSHSSTEVSIPGAIVGNAIAGGVGALVLGLDSEEKCSKIQVVIVTLERHLPELIIDCFDSKSMTFCEKKGITKDGPYEELYKRGRYDASRIISLMYQVIEKNKSKKINN